MEVYEDNWDTRDCVYFHVLNMLLKNAIPCVHIFLVKMIVLLKNGQQWNAYKFRQQVLSACLFTVSLCQSLALKGTSICKRLMTQCGLLGTKLHLIVIPAMLAIFSNLEWCFHIFLQGVAYDASGLRRQLFFLLIQVHRTARCFRMCGQGPKYL